MNSKGLMMMGNRKKIFVLLANEIRTDFDFKLFLV